MSEIKFKRDTILNVFHINFINQLVNFARINSLKFIHDDDLWICVSGLKELLYLNLSNFKSTNTLESSYNYFNKCNDEIKYIRISSFENEIKENFCIALKETNDITLLSKDELKFFAKAFKRYCEEFYSYNDLNEIIDNEIRKLKEEIELFRSHKETTSKSENSEFSPRKLKTNLTVDQLAFLFKMLGELKPDLFDINTKTQLYDFIASSFETKMQSDLSPKSIKNKMAETTPDQNKVLDFWETHLRTMLSEIKKFK